MKSKQYLVSLTLVASLGVTTFCAADVLAYSSANSNGVYEICAEDLYLRNSPEGPVIDRLKRGSHFTVTSNAGGKWVYGYSNWTGRHGWVENGWFC